MCGRFDVDANQINPEIEKYFGINFNAVTNHDVRPTNIVSTLIDKLDTKTQLNASWGIRPNWARKLLINAQAETAFKKKTFSYAMKNHRCLVPCSGWYEWSAISGKKHKYLFKRNDNDLLLMAGIYFESTHTSEINHQIVTLTTQPTLEAAPYHPRMPLFINESDVDYWFNARAQELQPLLCHRSELELDIYP